MKRTRKIFGLDKEGKCDERNSERRSCGGGCGGNDVVRGEPGRRQSRWRQRSDYRIYPAIGDLYGSNGPQTIASGGTSFGALGSSAISGFVSGTQIVFTPELTYTPSPATFNGFDVVDLTSPIASVTLDSSSAPFPPANLSLGGAGHDVYVNFANVPLTLNDAIVVDVSTGVPEASTWTLMAVGFAGLGFAVHRRPRRSVELSQG